MAWSWSHTAEAYENANAQMQALPRKTREIIAAEWLATPKDQFGGYSFSIDINMKKYHHSVARVGRWSDERLNDFIWGRMEELATCTNGGFEAYCCPHGCMPHMVPFDPVGEADEEVLYRVLVGDRCVMQSGEYIEAAFRFEDMVHESKFKPGSPSFGQDVKLMFGEEIEGAYVVTRRSDDVIEDICTSKTRLSTD